MVILALLTDGYGTHGGIADYNSNLLRALSLSPTVGRVLVLPRYGHAAAAAAAPDKVYQFRAIAGKAAYGISAVRRATQADFDVIFCGHLFTAPLAAMIARATGRPLWLQVHGIEAWAQPGSVVRLAANSARLVTAVSRHTRRRFLDWSGVDPAQVRVLPNTVSDDYSSRPREVDYLRIRHKLRGRKVVLTVSRLSATERYKGHERVMEALPRISALYPEVSYLIVGDGNDRPRLQAQSAALGLTDRVVFTGHVSREELPDYFALADVFAMPSTGEGFGIVFLEAAAAGLPVIGGDRDGSLDALADGQIGKALDPDNVEQLSSAICQALEGGRSIQPRAVSRFAFDKFANHVDEILKNLP